AEADFLKCLSLDPTHVDVYYNLGTTLQNMFRIEEAIEWYGKSLSYKPESAKTHCNLGFAYLILGQFEKGWPELEWRWRNQEIDLLNRNFSQPQWQGEAFEKGQTLLVHAEQGVGDTIQFLRYLPWVVSLGWRVLFEVPRVMIPLLQSIEGIEQFIANGDTLPDFDWHCPLLSLPHAHKTTTLPPPIKLPLPHILRKEWKDRIALIDKGTPKTKVKKIGLAWSGDTRHLNDKHRSIPTTQLFDYLPDKYQYVCLQNKIRERDLPAMNCGLKIAYYGTYLTDFAQTAALCMELDLVISVDTSLAHLSGILDQKTWILLPYSADWRWLMNREDSIWYSDIHLFRQPTLGDWHTPLMQVRERLLNEKF
ncbi:MAG: tetratricopeptide repeat protein, partial [Gammaproteobacteria bacterium]|nr:tetratricopeptide repeat protein [Gammaproteobacteria bacterium]